MEKVGSKKRPLQTRSAKAFKEGVTKRIALFNITHNAQGGGGERKNSDDI